MVLKKSYIEKLDRGLGDINVYDEIPWFCSSYILDEKLKHKKMFTPMQVQSLVQYAEEQRLIAERCKFESEQYYEKYLKMEKRYKKEKSKNAPSSKERKEAINKAIKDLEQFKKLL